MWDLKKGTRKTWRDSLAGIAILLCILGMLACGCSQLSPGTASPTPTVSPAATPAEIANPAAVACLQDDYEYEIRKNPDGSEYGVCILPDGTVCNEWQYLRGECPAPATTTTEARIPNPSAVFCNEKGLKYETRKNPDGSEYGVCILSDGTVCNAWKYYRGECP